MIFKGRILEILWSIFKCPIEYIYEKSITFPIIIARSDTIFHCLRIWFLLSLWISSVDDLADLSNDPQSNEGHVSIDICHNFKKISFWKGIWKQMHVSDSVIRRHWMRPSELCEIKHRSCRKCESFFNPVLLVVGCVWTRMRSGLTGTLISFH